MRFNGLMGGWLAVVVLVVQVCIPAAAARQTALDERLAARVEALLEELEAHPHGRGIRAGIAVYDATRAEWLYTHHADKAFVPASNQKLLVTACALEQLGPDHRFRTEVYARGTLTSAGVLRGDLVLKGNGDPSLSTEDVASIARRLRERGLREVQGRILVDESLFDDVRLGPAWMWDDEPYGYSAQVSALAVNKNTVTVTIEPDGPAGHAAKLSVQPEQATLRIENRVTSAPGEKSDIRAVRLRGQNTAVVSGTIGREAEAYREAVTVEEPALYAADVFRRALRAGGVQLAGYAAVEKTVIREGQPLLVHESATLAELVTELNKESDNFYAEMLLKYLGAVRRGEGSFSAGTAVVQDYLKRAGIRGGYRQVDGSGLSRLNLITPRQLVHLLWHVRRQPYSGEFFASLPVAGVDGTLEERMKGTWATGNLRAKTGTMDGVSSLSGTVTAKNGDTLLFSILLNGVYDTSVARAFLDQMGVMLAAFPDELHKGAALGGSANGNRPAPDAPSPFGTAKGGGQLARRLEAILNDRRLEGVMTGAVVLSLDRRQHTVLFSRQADKLFTPAAAVQLITAWAALTQLGPEFRFRTDVYVSGYRPSTGGLVGGLIVKGHGDPTLHHDMTAVPEGWSLDGMARVLRANGISRINGPIVVDDSVFDDERLGRGWTWDRESDPEQAQVTAFAVDRAVVRVRVKPGAKPGDPVVLELPAGHAVMDIVNHAVTAVAGEERTFSLTRRRGQNVLTARGQLSVDATPFVQAVTVEDPAIYAGELLKEQLRTAGIDAGPDIRVRRRTTPAGARKVAEFRSPPLAEILLSSLAKGDSFSLEMILKATGLAFRGVGSREAGVDAAKQQMAKVGIDTTMQQADASGLSRYSLLSPAQVTEVLAAAFRDPGVFPYWYQALPGLGQPDWHLQDGQGAGKEPRLRGITGTIPGVGVMAGYATTATGERLAFTVLMNGCADEAVVKEVQNRIAAVLAAGDGPITGPAARDRELAPVRPRAED